MTSRSVTRNMALILKPDTQWDADTDNDRYNTEAFNGIDGDLDCYLDDETLSETETETETEAEAEGDIH
jgi:hypothetical protein